MDRDLMFNFRKTVTAKEIINDIKYLKGLDKSDEDEYIMNLNYIAWDLLADYEEEVLNYKSYLADCKDMRMLYEFRKTYAISWLGYEQVYDVIEKCETADEIREVRKALLQDYFPGYYDLDWHYWLVLRKSNRAGYGLDRFEICWEEYFEDCDKDLVTSTEIADKHLDFTFSWFLAPKEVERKFKEWNQRVEAKQAKMTDETLKNKHSAEIIAEADMVKPTWDSRFEVRKQIEELKKQYGKGVRHRNHVSHIRSKKEREKLWYYTK